MPAMQVQVPSNLPAYANIDESSYTESLENAISQVRMSELEGGQLLSL